MTKEGHHCWIKDKDYAYEEQMQYWWIKKEDENAISKNDTFLNLEMLNIGSNS